MWQYNIFRNWPFVALAAVLLVGCSETTTDPQGFDTPVVESNNTFLSVQDDVETLSDGGVAVDSAYGVFSLGWNQFITPMQTEATTSSHAFAIAYDDLQAITRRPRGGGGLDLGQVSIAYSGNAVNLNQKESHDGGFLYALFNHPRQADPVNIEFVGGATYDMVITGSDMFLPLTVSLTAPAEAININSHASGDSVSSAEALTLNWSGGTTDDRVLLRIGVHMKPRHDGPHRPHDRGGHQPGDGPPLRNGGHQPGDRPMPHQKPDAIFVVFDTNPGTYTVTAEDMAALLSDGESDGMIGIHLTQVAANEVLHEGKTYATALRTGERLVLSVQ